jgi:DNA-directed RNA polymerase specialized sigma24 family protein
MAADEHHPLTGTGWSDVQRRLTAYAVFLYRTDRVMAGTGVSPADLANDVILELLKGKIAYDGRRALLPLLKKALFHDFLDIKKSAGRRTTVILTGTESEEGEVIGGLESLPASEEAQPDVLFRQIVYDTIGDDPELRDFACAVLELGASKPADIASVLGVTVDEVENRRKRLRRVLAPVRARLGT